MKTLKKFIISLISIYVIFICEEGLRLQFMEVADPIVILDKTSCDVNDINCYNNDLYVEEFKSVGFNVINTYHLSSLSHDDIVFYQLVTREFRLFDKVKVWKVNYIETRK